MSEQITLSVRRDADTALVIEAAGVDIARYVFDPQSPTSESPKPFLHPLTTLSGAPLTVHRPWDHRWHKGLQMTLSHVSGDNFWGGPTFAVDDGYQWRGNLGSIVHESFDAIDETGPDVAVTEKLAWISSAGERWIDETRTHRFHSADAARGVWVLDFTTTLVNVRGADLELGSPSTHGRPDAGYTGYFWRGPRAWTGGTVVASTGVEASDIMGAEAEWIGYSSEHDDIDGGGTIIVFAGSSTASVPIKWFVRTEPFAAISPSPSFDEEVVLAPGETLGLGHRHVFVDRVCSADEMRALADEFAL